MRILLVPLATLLLAWSSDAVVAKSTNCVPDRGCAEGERANVDCCQRPPCEFFMRLMEQKWWVRAHLSDKTMEMLKQKYAWDVTFDEYWAQRLEFGGGCPRNPFVDEDPPTFHTAGYWGVDVSSCQLVVSLNDQDRVQSFSSLAEVLEKTRTCEEFVEDEYSIGMELATQCAAYDPKTSQSNGPNEYWLDSIGRAEARLWKMEAHLNNYCKLCTCSPEAELARFVVQYANPPLKDPPNKKRPPKKTPKRAAQKSR